MSSYFILIIIIGISAAFAYINQRYIRMPFVIGLFFLSTLLSLFILSAAFWAKDYFTQIQSAVAGIDISKYILQYMLGYLLFAGSLHTRWSGIKRQLVPISIFAVFGVLFSAFIVGVLFYGLCSIFHFQASFIYCLLFGALISPTDPVAVLGILTKAKVPEKIKVVIVGESLFNDGVGVVVFISILEVLKTGGGGFQFSEFGILFLKEAVGGILFGLAAGYVLHKIISSIDHYETEVLLTLAFVMLGYGFCGYINISGALAMVIMGLFVGNYNHHHAMSQSSKAYVYKFWELIDVVLNAILFVMIAFVMVVIHFGEGYILIAAGAILIVLISRVVIIYLPKVLLPKIISYTHKESRLIVWGGLRGGLSIAMVLSLPDGEAKNILLVATYACVVFSILVQGLTIEKMAAQ